MGLEAATFINQLNAANPVGAVDPKGQGDDHIRMIKATIQASFPNITGAMTRTQAELNAMAANTGFAAPTTLVGSAAPAAGVLATVLRSDAKLVLDQTVNYSWTGVHTFTKGSGTIGMTWTDGTVITNYFSSGGSTIANFGTSSNHPLVMNVNGSEVARFKAGQFATVDGLIGAPAFTFTADLDLGIYRRASNQLGFAASGADMFVLDATQASFLTTAVYLPAGNQGTPGVTFGADTNTGWFSAGADDMRASAGGSQRFKISTSLIECINGVQLAPLVGNAGAPGLACSSDLNTGIYFDGADGIFGSEGGTGFRLGYRQIPRSTTATTLAIGDVGKCVAIAAAINIPISVFAAGDAVSIYNDSAGALNLTITAGGTLRLAGTASTGTRSIAARGFATIWFNSGGATPEAIASGNVS